MFLRRVVHGVGAIERPPRPLQGRSIAVFGSSTALPQDRAWQLAHEIGRGLAERGALLLTGGYGGVMEAASRGACTGGGSALGVTLAGLFPERTPNMWITERHDAASLLDRLDRLFACDAFVVLEGGVGTLAEFFLAWHHALLEGERRRVVLCVGEGWPRLLAALRECGFVAEEDLLEKITVLEGAREVLARLEAALAPRC